jgi:class 3 adenylate cyclase
MKSLNDIDSPIERTLLIAITDMIGFAKEFRNRTHLEMFDLMSQFYELIENEIKVAGGRVVKFIGDSALLVCQTSS